ncbi:TlpA disulfide reductase family protein [Luteibaculum oceani]|uniref:TlpA family protein disulfide reductase n=1 Tax=Luteibaculum oceani TaxID=1294296 RepID=A0A5C6VKS5_9FLAO|nr:TlpA disulfide reductase family protein [Luteibaculum oceani]TXC85361.1 TlpA family protein disulfide reductase [Luteibaculum oceani]
MIYRILVLLLIITSCTTNSTENLKSTSGKYTLKMDLGNKPLLINSEISNGKLLIYNGLELISLPIDQNGDSLIANFSVFDSGFELIAYENGYKGFWKKYYKKDYSIPVSLIPNWTYENEVDNQDTVKYQIQFSPNTSDEYPAIGLFSISDTNIAGSFATETGDYRFLQGKIINNKFTLNTLDGSHAFLFTGEFIGDSIKGMFYSGTHWKEPFTGYKSERPILQHPDSITKVTNEVEFAFLNLDSTTYKFNRNSATDTAVIIQILGSWCPNCLDETQFLSEIQQQYKNKPLKIIGISFESKNQFSYYKKQIEKLKKSSGISYPILFGGKASKQLASDTLLFIDEIKSFPTTIIMDKNHKIKKVHTGFYGPGTGSYYVKFKEDFTLLLDKILQES